MLRAIENFRECLKRINSPERYYDFLNSGFHVILRDEQRTVGGNLATGRKNFKITVIIQ